MEAEVSKLAIPGELFCLQAKYSVNEMDQTEGNTDPLLAFKSTMDPNTMYYLEARREKDWPQFE